MPVKREHDLTRAQIQRSLRLLSRWKSYVRLWAKLGYAPSNRQCQKLWTYRTTASVSYILWRLVTSGLIRKPQENVIRSFVPNAEIVETGGKLYALTRY